MVGVAIDFRLERGVRAPLGVPGVVADDGVRRDFLGVYAKSD